jgi:excinuclease ABC subunit C
MNKAELEEIHAALRVQVDAFPRMPGVYLMRDKSGTVIYVGKAKDLRARVRSYFAGGDGRSQIAFLLQRIRALEKIVTESEHQAFVLERDLIAKYKPRYNIRLKDDKEFLSIRIDENAEWPRLELVRRMQEDGARYFGPYSFSYELRSLLEIIKRVVPLRSCTNTIFYNRQRPCLEYQIKRCCGPCCLPVDRSQYRAWVKQAISILEGKTEQLAKDLTGQMDRASEELRFEDAAVLRDRLAVLSNFKKGQSLISADGEHRDVFALYREERLAALVVLKVRYGRSADSTTFSLNDVEIGDAGVVESAVTQYYESGREVPAEIIVPFDLENESMLAEELSLRAGHRVEFIVPQRGVKFRLLNIAQVNAKAHFSATFDAEARYVELSRKLSRTLALRQIPRRIECVDISNFQGSEIVGALVAFVDGEHSKELYRKYKISRQGKPDDFAAVHEVVSRRLERGKEEGDLPDLLIIDGGPGQLAKALEARDALGVALEIISIAKMRSAAEGPGAAPAEKKPERIYREGKPDPLALADDDDVTHFLQRIRDEVHRFVITFHRTRRAHRVFRSVLDDIAGVGPERRSRLLREYGSIERLRQAGADDVARAGRMPKPLAEKILRVLGENLKSESEQ